MKKIGLIILAAAIFCSASGIALASDWDVAGKILTGLEGLRVLSGGRVDPVGNMFGLDRNSRQRSNYAYRNHQKRIWVPNYSWARRWVPEHSEYDPAYGEVVIEGHYIRYKVENGGYWEYR